MQDWKKDRREAAARLAQLRKILHTYAIASGGGAVALIVTQGPNGTVWAWAGIVVALAFHAATLYLAPVAAEKTDDD